MADSSVRVDEKTMQTLEDQKALERKQTGRKIYIKDLIRDAIKKCYGGKL